MVVKIYSTTTWVVDLGARRNSNRSRLMNSTKQKKPLKVGLASLTEMLLLVLHEMS